MYTADIDQATLRALRSMAPPAIRSALDKFNRSWNALRRQHEAANVPLSSLPAAFTSALRQAASAMESHFAEAPSSAADGPLQQFYFELLGFQRLVDSFGPHSVLELEEDVRGPGKRAATLRIRNLIPASFLKPRFESARSATLFSATLSPSRYYIDMLGLPESTACITVESPFSPEQLQVRLVSAISTRFAHRQRSAEPIARLIAQQFESQQGNYLAFFSSFDYLDMVAAEFARRYPRVPVWMQSRGMDEGARQAFLDRFVPGSAGVGFAVLGGSFGEGIDLRGDRLVGAFVATLGLPQLNARNEQLKDCLEGMFGAGYDYTYLYPGIQKVVQAAGRVIRTQEDRGVLYLIDDRFARPSVRELLPAWWRIERHDTAGAGSPR
jgi:Rad3-related DNA helicase